MAELKVGDKVVIVLCSRLCGRARVKRTKVICATIIEIADNGQVKLEKADGRFMFMPLSKLEKM